MPFNKSKKYFGTRINKNKIDLNINAMRILTRYVLISIEKDVSDEHLRNWMEFSRRIQCDTKNTFAENDERNFGFIRSLLVKYSEEGYLTKGDKA